MMKEPMENGEAVAEKVKDGVEPVLTGVIRGVKPPRYKAEANLRTPKKMRTNLV